MKMYVCILALVGLSHAGILQFEPESQQAAGAIRPPKFCNGLDCPKFVVVQTTENYEERKYDTSKWVTTELTGVDFNEAMSTMFMRLFNYISGDNKASQKIAMTVPVITRIIPGQGSACESNFTLSFYLAIDTAPEPTTADVYLNTLPQNLDVYVKSYRGYSSRTKFLKLALNLAQELSTSATYVKDYYYVCGYDSPFKFWSRHNEVWFVKN